jgi:hypothetical protein
LVLPAACLAILANSFSIASSNARRLRPRINNFLSIYTPMGLISFRVSVDNHDCGALDRLKEQR